MHTYINLQHLVSIPACNNHKSNGILYKKEKSEEKIHGGKSTKKRGNRSGGSKTGQERKMKQK